MFIGWGHLAYGRRPNITQNAGAIEKDWLKGEGNVLYEASKTVNTLDSPLYKASKFIEDRRSSAGSATSSELGWIQLDIASWTSLCKQNCILSYDRKFINQNVA